MTRLTGAVHHRNVLPPPPPPPPLPKSGMGGCSVDAGGCAALRAAPPPPPHSPLSQPPPPEAALPAAGAALGDDDDSRPLSPPPSSDRPADSNPRGISGGAVDAAGAVVCASPAGLCISMSSNMGGGGGAVSLVIIMPMPSIPASRTPPNTALRPALAMPCRSCRKPPVSAPDAMAFHGSSCTDAGVRTVPRWPLHSTTPFCGQRPVCSQTR